MLDHFGVRGWPNRAKKGDHVLIIFPMFLVFLCISHLTTPHNTHTHTIPHAFLSVSCGFQCFSTRTTPHNIHNTQTHTHTHTCTPATDRDLESGLSTTRGKNPGKCLKKAKSGETLARARADTDGQIVRLRRSGEKTNRTIWWLVPSQVSLFFKRKRMIRGIGNALLSTYSQTSNGQNPVVTLGQPLV